MDITEITLHTGHDEHFVEVVIEGESGMIIEDTWPLESWNAAIEDSEIRDFLSDFGLGVASNAQHEQPVSSTVPSRSPSGLRLVEDLNPRLLE